MRAVEEGFMLGGREIEGVCKPAASLCCGTDPDGRAGEDGREVALSMAAAISFLLALNFLMISGGIVEERKRWKQC